MTKKPKAAKVVAVVTATPFAERIMRALAHGYVPLGELETHLFPEDKYPNAFRCSGNGGPPGCRWTLVAALKRFGVPISDMGYGNSSSLVGPWPGTSVPVETMTAKKLKALGVQP